MFGVACIRRIALVLILVRGVGLPGRSHAETHGSTASSARELSEQARRAYNLGNWQEAIEAFARAYQMTGDPALLFNLGQANRQAGRTSDALRFYRGYLREDPKGLNSAIAQQQIEQIESHAAAAPIEPSPTVVPPPARNEAPAALAAEAAGRDSTSPGSGDRPETTSGQKPLSKTVSLDAPHATSTGGVSMEMSTESRSETPRRPLPGWVPWTAGSVTVALLASAIIVHMAANSRYNSLQTSCGKTAEGCSPGQVDGVKSRDLATTTLLIVGGVGAVGTGLAFYANGTF